MSVLTQKDAAQVEHLEVTFSNYGWKEKPSKTLVYEDPAGIDEYLECTNPVCRRGRFPLGRMIREMVRDRIEEMEKKDQFCNADEVSGRKCLYGFDIKVCIRYKEA